MTYMNKSQKQSTYFRVGSASDAFVSDFLNNGRILFFNKHELIYRDEETVDGIFLVLDGVVECFYVENGKRRIFAFMGKGSLLGVIGTISQRHTSTLCSTDCVIAFLEKEKLYQMGHSFLEELFHMQVEKTHWFIQSENNIVLDNVRMRLLRFLYEAAQLKLIMGREDLPVKLRYSNREIASIISTSREYVTRLLKELQKEARIEGERGEIILYPCDIGRLL